MRSNRAFAGIPLILALSVAGCSESKDGSDGTSAGWQGRTYVLDVPPANWSEPEQVGDEMGGFVPDFLIQVEESDGDVHTVTLGAADTTGAQDTCNPTTRVQTVAQPYPSVQIGPTDMMLRLQWVADDPAESVTVLATGRGLTMTNVLPDGDVPAEEGELTATMDAREVYPLFHILPDPNPEAVCNALASFEATCGPCPHDGENFCLALTARYLGATEVADVDLEQVDADSLDPSCTE